MTAIVIRIAICDSERSELMSEGKEWIARIVEKRARARKSDDAGIQMETERNGRFAARLDIFARELSSEISSDLDRFNKEIERVDGSMRRGVRANIASPYQIDVAADAAGAAVNVTVSREGRYVEAKMTQRSRRALAVSNPLVWNLKIDGDEIVAYKRDDEDEAPVPIAEISRSILLPFFAAAAE